MVVIGRGLSGPCRPKDRMPTLKISQVNDQSECEAWKSFVARGMGEPELPAEEGEGEDLDADGIQIGRW